MSDYKRTRLACLCGVSEKELPWGVGVLCPIPKSSCKEMELQTTTSLDKKGEDWELAIVKKAFLVGRQRPMNELLFCMLRAGH